MMASFGTAGNFVCNLQGKHMSSSTKSCTLSRSSRGRPRSPFCLVGCVDACAGEKGTVAIALSFWKRVLVTSGLVRRLHALTMALVRSLSSICQAMVCNRAKPFRLTLYWYVCLAQNGTLTFRGGSAKVPRFTDDTLWCSSTSVS